MEKNFTWDEFRTDPLSEVIGRGSSGTVLYAHSTARGLRRSYAIKVYHKHGLPYETILEKAEHEAGIVKAMHNQLQFKNNIVTVFGLVAGPISASPTIMTVLKTHLDNGIIAENAIGLVMSYEEGGSLEDLLYPPVGTPKIPLTMTDKIKILIDIVSGLYEIHYLGTSHNDVKPGNVLMSRKGDLSAAFFKLADFGLSKQNDQVTGLSVLSATVHGQNALKGTFLYMALELFEEVAPSRRSDMYAFGMLLWEVMAEQKPYGNVPNFGNLVLRLSRGEKPDSSLLPEGM